MWRVSVPFDIAPVSSRYRFGRVVRALSQSPRALHRVRLRRSSLGGSTMRRSSARRRRGPCVRRWPPAAAVVAAVAAPAAAASSSSSSGSSSPQAGSGPCGTDRRHHADRGPVRHLRVQGERASTTSTRSLPEHHVKEDVVEQSADYWTRLKTRLASGSGLDDVQAHRDRLRRRRRRRTTPTSS